MRFSICKKAVKDFKTLNPSTSLIADLMLYISECASEVANGCGDLWDSYNSSYTNFMRNEIHSKEWIANKVPNTHRKDSQKLRRFGLMDFLTACTKSITPILEYKIND